MINVINVKWGGEFVYIGRSFGGFKGSVLGNRFKIGVDGDREEVIKKYRVWLWSVIKKGEGIEFDEFVRLCKKEKEEENLNLGCWCKKKGVEISCHGDVLRNGINWYNSSR